MISMLNRARAGHFDSFKVQYEDEKEGGLIMYASCEPKFSRESFIRRIGLGQFSLSVSLSIALLER